MNTKIVMSLFMVLAMIGIAAPLASACGNCDVEIPDCYGCYQQVATASLDKHGAEGTATIINNAVGLQTNIEIKKPHGDVWLQVGTAIPGDGVTAETYGVFGLGGKADVEMTSLAVVYGCMNCGANVESNVEVEIGHDGATGGSGATFNTESAGWFFNNQEITASGGVQGDIKKVELNAVSQNGFAVGTTHAMVYDYGNEVGSYAGATFLKSKFCRFN